MNRELPTGVELNGVSVIGATPGVVPATPL